ncbi:mpv17-like protein 2 [Biomphalaria glabrata]|uniref:Mpv17-like protein 2 n=1 Tax=Biomphalaria glabrata TaxID=6526 RepID=A0A9U8EH40_BIOGL|nr:mpv17-like protein 2 [Biomphalaria glabrata]
MRLFQRLSATICPTRCHFTKATKVLFSSRYLLYTNTALSTVVSVAGDLIQQNYQRIQNDNSRIWSSERTVKIAAVGLAFGPSVHYWYIGLEKLVPGKTLRAIMIKVCMDQFIFSPYSISMFLIIIGIIEGQGFDLLKNQFKKTAGLMFMTDMSIWTPAQLVNFYFVPIKYRVLYDNCVSLLADTLYSYLRFDHDKYDLEDNDEQ